jgi:hypothetical protein
MATPRTYASSFAPTVAVVLGLAITGAYVSVLLILMDTTPFDVWGAAVLAPVLIALSVPVLRRQATREADPGIFRLLLLAVVVKLAGSVARYYVAFTVYGGAADATRYHQDGALLAERLRHLDLSGLHIVVGTDFVRVVTGVVEALIGPSKLGGFLFFSWLGFWGLFLFYRAFVLAVPLGRARSYAHLLFFLPSLVFWPSSIGKEAWMMFALGICAYGVAKILVGETWRGYVVASAGLWLAGMVRPHMAALVAVSLALAAVMRKSKKEHRELAPALKGVSVIAVAVLAIVLVARSERFLETSGIDVDQGVSTTLSDLQSRTSEGGAAFVPSIVNSPWRAPMAAVTVLFRPFVFEVHNLQSLIAAIEGTMLMLLCLLRIRWVSTALRSLRKQPFVAFCLVYCGLFIVAFSGFANFGLLARQRVQLYPLFLVLLSIPPLARSGREGDQEAEVARS